MEDIQITKEINLNKLAERLKNIRDLSPPMSIITLNQLIEEIDNAISIGKRAYTDHSGYEIGSGR